MTKTALIVVDMQNDFVLPNGSLYVPGAENLIEGINEQIRDDRYDLIVASQDWHPPEHGSFASNHPEGHEVGEIVDLDGLDQILWPDHCVQGTEGAEFVEGLDVERFDRVFQKGTDPLVDSYSAFYDNDHRKSTGLTNYLRDKGIDEVHVCGVALNFCCLYTCIDSAQTEGFDTSLLYNITGGVEMEEGDIARALKDILDAGASILT